MALGHAKKRYTRHEVTAPRAVSRPAEHLFSELSKNKSSKPGVFFAHQDMSVNWPQPPHITARFTFQTTTFCIHFSQIPCKTHKTCSLKKSLHQA